MSGRRSPAPQRPLEAGGGDGEPRLQQHRRHAHLRGHGGGQRVRELLGRQEETQKLLPMLELILYIYAT